MNQPIPLIILGGSDGQSGPVPDALHASEMLSGFKGALMLPSGRCLAAELINRYRQTGRFTEPILLGPPEIYSHLVDCEVVRVNGSLVNTLRRVWELIHERFDPGQPVAISACDILPTSNEIQELLADGYDRNPSCSFWWQIILAEPHAMGASDWKPRYGLRESAEGELRTAYPGHLVILRPAAIRMELLITFLGLCYRYRNLPIHRRLFPMLGRGLALLIGQDIRNLSRLQLPILTVTIPWHVLRAYREVRTGRFTIERFERHAARVALHRRARQRGSLVISPTDLTSFAKDIDSQRELDALNSP